MNCDCGSDLFWRNLATMGNWRQLVKFDKDNNAEVVDTSTDGLRMREPKTVICGDCGKRHPNPAY